LRSIQRLKEWVKSVIDEAIRQVEKELAAAAEQHNLARDLERIASARYMALVSELVDLCKAKQAAESRKSRTLSKTRPNPS
jgi:uncharacterized protein YPO0396